MATTTNPPTDPTPSDPKVAAATLDFLLIELVPLAQRMAVELHARDTALLAASMDRSLALNTSTSGGALGLTSSGLTSSSAAEKRQSVKSMGTNTAGGAGTNKDVEDEDEDEEGRSEDVMWRLDALGYRVGQGLVERFSANTPRPTTPLDMIKFICKDLWQLVFRKQIDNLKTNHRGTFVLTDNKFMALGRMSADTRRGPRGADEALGKAQPFLYFPCGIIRGALSGFGLNVTVHAESTELPQATFQIRTVGSKP